MAQQTIGIGTTANDGTGDPLRTAFNKTNLNFTDLYTATTSPNPNIPSIGKAIAINRSLYMTF